MARIVCVGDNTVDTYIDQCRQFPGGNAVNVAALVSRLGAQSAYVGCVGDDDRGRAILTALAEEGVDISHCRTLIGDTAWACVSQRKGDRVFLGSSPGVSRKLHLETSDLDYFEDFDWIHSSAYSRLEGDLAQVQAANENLCFDFSDNLSDCEIDQLAPYVKMAFFSGAHLNELECKALLYRVRSLGPSIAVVTRGELGSMALANGEVISQPITATKALDTLGAGDGFITAFLLEWHTHRNLRQAMQAGADHAAFVCNYEGGFGHGRPAPVGEIEEISHTLNLM